jgi:cytochrome b6-f complex iron-sulfur subunit
MSETSTTFKRRRLLWSTMFAGLAASFGTLTSYALAFIFPRRPEGPPKRLFIGFARELAIGASKSAPLPSGDQLIVSNTGKIDPAAGSPFIGFSNQCPHLGCKVHWESGNQRFVCPCHGGMFRPDGIAYEGPPAQAGQKLRAYPIQLEGDSMYAVLEEG